MLEKNVINIEIESSHIKILVGSKSNVKCFGIIDTPKDSFIDDTIRDADLIADAISEFLKEKRIKTRNVSFAIKGQDIVVRHIETPIMNHNGIWETIQSEVAQYLPEGGENYYSDYEIEEKINTKEKKMYKLMIVSASKEKINSYAVLADKMKLRIVAIDIISNSICRVFKKVFNGKEPLESIGIINLGVNSSSLTILKDGRLFIEKEVPFGMINAASVFNVNKEIDKNNKLAKFFCGYTMSKKNESDNAININSLFDDMFLIFDRVIQFFSTGRAQKNLDKLYIIGEGSEIKEIRDYVENYFNTKCEIIKLPKQVFIGVTLSNQCDFGRYINTFGLMLREDRL